MNGIESIDKEESKKEQAKFKISFISSDESDHEIDAETLGRSLQDLTKLVRNSLKSIQGEESRAKINVAAHEPGSFVVDFIAYLDAGGIEALRTVGILAPTAAVTAPSLITLLLRLNKRKVETVVEKDNGKTFIIADDHEEIDVTPEVAKLVENYSVRKNLEEFILKPMENPIIEKVVIKDTNIRADGENEEFFAEFTKDKRAMFVAPPKKDLTLYSEKVHRENIEFTVISFEKVTGWSIKLDDKTINVKINDSEFWTRIASKREEFKKGQIFEVDLKTVISNTNGSEATKYSIEKVH
ncbi:hypothetical protein ACOI22_03525 [Glaciecola sp. 2405UD65-10]|uniref:hypothetical protein n=1 Tax=Glaciecola sp. 2405UD65-10 TaxID=3397244 RepID=UPI003B5AB0CA